MAKKQSTVSIVLAVAAISALYVGLAWFGNASSAAANLYDYPFNDTLVFGDFLRDMGGLSIAEVLSNSDVDTMMPFSNLVLLGSFVIAAGGFVLRQWAAVLAAFVIVLPHGLMGLLAGLGPFDGEWVGEGWAMLAAISVWMVCLAIIGAVTFARSTNGVDERIDAAALV